MKAAVSFDRILESVGGFGVWQVSIIAITFASGTLFLFHNLCYVVDSTSPGHWCEVNQLDGVNWTHQEIKEISIPREEDSQFSRCAMYDRNYSVLSRMTYEEAANMTSNQTDIIPCQSWHYDGYPYSQTTVRQWDLVCDRKALRPTIQTVATFGVLCSGLVTGLLADKIGRRKTILAGVLVIIPSLFMAAMSSNYYLFLLLRFITGLAAFGIYANCYVLVSEVMVTSKRANACLVFDMGAALGVILSAVTSYWLPNWRHLHLAAAGLSCTFLLYFRYVPESPRWLILKGRFAEAEKILLKASEMNRTEPPSADNLRSMMEDFRQSEIGPIGKETKSSTWDKVKHVAVLWRTREMRSRSLKMFWAWFVIGTASHALIYMGARLPAGPHLVMLVKGCEKFLVRFLVMWQIALVGRRPLFSTCFFIIAIFVAIFIATKDELEYGAVALIVVAMVADDCNFTNVYIYTAELFPTEVRSYSISAGCLHARIGGMLAPFLVDYLGARNEYVPGLTLIVVSAFAGLTSAMLPETRGCKLPESVAEVEKSRDKKVEPVTQDTRL